MFTRVSKKFLINVQSWKRNASTSKLPPPFITFNDLRDDVYNEVVNHKQIAGVGWTRFVHLNKLLLGHRKGELTVLTGPTGSGKTTFMSEYSLDLCMQGVRTLWGSFEIKNSRLAKTMLTQFAGMRLENNMTEFDHWADAFSKLPLFFLAFHGPQNFNTVLQALKTTTKQNNIDHIVVDNLQFMLGSGENSGHHDRFWQQDVVIGAFRKFCNDRNCHVTLVVHPRKEQNEGDLNNSSIFGGVKASQEADNILILQDRRLITPKGRKYLQVTKNRFSGDLGMFPLEFDKESLSFTLKKKISPVKVKNEFDDSQAKKNVTNKVENDNATKGIILDQTGKDVLQDYRKHLSQQLILG